jgi:hypothetical protein
MGRQGAATQVRVAIATFLNWTQNERLAVFNQIDALISMRGVSGPGIAFLSMYETSLKDLGIDPNIF